MALLRPLIRFANHPWVVFAAGLFLIVASAAELQESLLSFEEGLEGEHGTFLYGIVLALKSLAELDEGLEKVGEGGEAKA